MEADDYQERAHGFASGDDGKARCNSSYAYFGLAEEAGEVLGKVAKFSRHNDGIDPWTASMQFPNALKEQNAKFRDDMRKELGDCLWMIAEIATANGLKLGEIMESNIAKLSGREERGTIDGSGDDR